VSRTKSKPKPPPGRTDLTVEEVAAAWGVSVRTVYRWLEIGERLEEGVHYQRTPSGRYALWTSALPLEYQP
jgi:predicted DNA-binding transcriptional regulator YafY